MLIGPIFDEEGCLHGVVQLVNKCHNEPITEKDVYEFGSLIPALG